MAETLVELQHHGNDATVLAGYECYTPSYMHCYSCRAGRLHITGEGVVATFLKPIAAGVGEEPVM